LFSEIPFNNVVYEFHEYAPITFTGQEAGITNMKYPNNNIVMIPNGAEYSYVDGLWDASKYNNSSSNTWQTLANITPETVPSSSINIGDIQIVLNNLASNTIVTIDQIKVSQYDKSNNYIKDVFFDDFSTDSNYKFEEASTGVTSLTRAQDSTNGGSSGGNAKIIQGPTGPDNTSGTGDTIIHPDWNTNFFKVDPNYKYQVSIHVKVQNPGPNTLIIPRIMYFSCDQACGLNKDYIASSIQKFIDYSNQNNVPVFMGEYGITNWCFNELKNISNGTLYTSLGQLGGEQWTDDILSIISANKLNSSFWFYDATSMTTFGLFAGNVTNRKTYVNSYLESEFIDYFSKF